MAATGVLTLVLLQLFSFLCRIHGQWPDLAIIQEKAHLFHQQIEGVLDEASAYHTIKNEYDNRRNRMTLEKVHGLETVKETARQIGVMLESKVESLKASVEDAEDKASNYTWDSTLTLEKVNWENAKRVNSSGDGYIYDAKFKKKVNYDNSSVHIPVEIYEGDIEILNGLQWTRNLDEQWRKNIEKDDKLLWQYFGTQTGIFRNYPASAWETRGEVDLYDVRRRPWYTQGASSPKDMLILVDTSGSTHGQALTLMKQSVKSLIETLGENDFVKVAQFSDKAGPVGCFPSFVQANHRNKKLLFSKVDDMEAKGMASYSVGLIYAFNEFKKLEATWTGDINATDSFTEEAGEGIGARCNRIIMFLTDGGTEMPEDVFREYNWPDKRIRIFSYAVGPTANPISAVKWIACANKGYFARIPAMGAIRSTVQEHVLVVARPLALAQARWVQWSNVYLDSLHYQSVLGRSLALNEIPHMHWSSMYEDKFNYVPVLARPRAISNIKMASWTNVKYDMGLGMMITVTLPVYNRTEDISNQTILGVMGTDVTTEEMQSFIPTQKLGSNGYAFAINNNGYVIFHPKLKAQKGWLEDPPNVDFLDVEEDTEDLQLLRKDMIDGKTDERTITSWSITSDEMHLDETTKTYSFTTIPGTNFSLAIVTEGRNSYYFESARNRNDSDSNETDSESALSSTETAVLLAPWNYCRDVVQIHNTSSPSEDMIYQINTGSSDCDQALVDHLLFDASTTLVLQSKWMSMAPIDIDARFVATQGGLTRIYPKSANQSFMHDRDIKTALYFQRALNSINWVFSAEYHTGDPDLNGTKPVITAAKSVVLSNPSDYKAAVSGVRVEQQKLLDTLTNTIEHCGREDIICYLLDDGGYLLLSTDTFQEFRIGQFFGEVDPVLMWNLVNNSIYVKHEKYDFQASCAVERRQPNAGSRSVFVPAIMDMLTVNWWTTKAAWLYAQYNVYEWLLGFVKGAEAASLGGDDFVERNKSCVKLLTQYAFNENEEEIMKKELAICGNCSRTFATSPVGDANLLLVLVERDCGENAECEHIPMDSSPKQVEDPLLAEAAESDDCPVESRYRVRPAECFDYDAREFDGDCGSGSRLLPSHIILILNTILLFIFIHQAHGC